MASLKQITTEVINTLNKPFDVPLYVRVRDLIIHEIASQIVNESAKFGVSQSWIQYCKIAVIRVDPADKQNVDTGKRIYRSENKLPKRVELSHSDPFVYVGTIDRTLPYIYVTNYIIALRMKDIEELGGAPKYSVRDGYLECYVEDANLKYVLIGNAFVHSGAISNETATNQHIPHDDESELLIDEDIIQRVKANILKNDLVLTRAEDHTITTSNNEDSATQ